MDRIVSGLFKIFILLFLITWLVYSIFPGRSTPPRDLATGLTPTTTLPPPLDASTPPVPAPPNQTTVPVSNTPVDQNAPILKADHEQIAFDIQGAQAQGSVLELRMTAVNNGPDRMIEISSFPWTKTLIYDVEGNVFRPSTVRVANVQASNLTRAMLISGVATPILLTFKVPTVRGKPDITKIRLFELNASVYDTNQARNNSFGQPVSQIYANFRNFDVEGLAK
jgi:hypothetical protein